MKNSNSSKAAVTQHTNAFAQKVFSEKSPTRVKCSLSEYARSKATDDPETCPEWYALNKPEHHEAFQRLMIAAIDDVDMVYGIPAALAKLANHHKWTPRHIIVDEAARLNENTTFMLQPQTPPIMLTITGYRKFLENLFEDWNSALDAPENPVLPMRTSKQTTICVGGLAQDLPLPAENQGTDTVLDEWRKVHAPVYFEMTLDYENGTVLWTWKDKRNRGFHPEYVGLTDGKTEITIRIQLLNQYESKERIRIK
ncbi:hypothetical protein FGADI_5299 [Fusarium gaditjirri]|uniref:Uncharacterized protein n=1 Tax=Fusarium gaditjirri TaxID=282569 RepID=A0A8H4TAN6_9HYPO|nr:hypothetical protein FGADI_5299 [Fusarium gaditjirri]